MTNTERCNSCRWFDSVAGNCDHCACGYPYVDYNGLTPDEVKDCKIYTKDESKTHEWQWNYYIKDCDEWFITSYQSKADDINWIKLEESKRLIVQHKTKEN